MHVLGELVSYKLRHYPTDEDIRMFIKLYNNGDGLPIRTIAGNSNFCINTVASNLKKAGVILISYLSKT